MTGQHSRESPISIIFPSQAISPRIPQKGQALGQCADLPKVKDTIPGMNFIANQSPALLPLCLLCPQL